MQIPVVSFFVHTLWTWIHFYVEAYTFKDYVSGVPSKGLRLNCVKRLARSLKSDLEKATSENHQNKMEGINYA